MKRIPLKIFIMVLIAGVIGIVGEIILKYDIDRLLDSYSEIINEHLVNQNYMDDISMMMYKHQNTVANHVISNDENLYIQYETKEAELREEIKTELYEFGDRMTGATREQLYHKVYSDYFSYLQNVDVTLKLSRDGSKGTAAHYVNTTMVAFLSSVDDNLQELSDLTATELTQAKDKMNGYIKLAQISQMVCVVVIAIAVIVSLIYCVKITSNLDKYKDDLEIQVEKKNQTLREHHEKMIVLQNNIIIGMANLIESRDGDTGEHIKRTSKYVSMLANAAKNAGLYTDILTDDYIELLVKAAPMHDIGKIAVPDSILQKPGKLTSEEFDVIKRHAPEGGKIAREVFEDIEDKDYVDIAVCVASYHHERWDGTGYMDGLAGEDIPLSARIMAIADVFDALISKRCYKAPMSVDEAFTIIRDSAGSHFDPRLAELFLSLRKDIEKLLME